MSTTPLPQYVKLGLQGPLKLPPYRRNVPRYEFHCKNSGGSCCLRCICYCYCLLFLIIFIFAAFSLYLYVAYALKVPSYKVLNFEVKQFNVQADFSLKTMFLVTVKADNPKEDIGFIYGKGSSIVAFYKDSFLCSGKLPNFHQDQNIQVELKAKSEFGLGLQEAYSDSKKQGKIPLLVLVNAPVTIMVGEFSIAQFVVNVNCSLVFDSLSPTEENWNPFKCPYF